MERSEVEARMKARYVQYWLDDEHGSLKYHDAINMVDDFCTEVRILASEAYDNV